MVNKRLGNEVYVTILNKAKDTREDMQSESFKVDMLTILMYQVGPDGHERLYVPIKMRPIIFEYAHDKHGHDRVNRVYNKLRLNIYMPKLRKLIEQFVTACDLWDVEEDQYYDEHESW